MYDAYWITKIYTRTEMNHRIIKWYAGNLLDFKKALKKQNLKKDETRKMNNHLVLLTSQISERKMEEMWF